MSASRGGGRSKKERVYRALRREILTLGLGPGQVLVERAVARRYGVSKTPVREALALLQQDGLVESLPRRGYLVTGITVRDVHELFEVRAALEGAAAELAATRISPRELKALEGLLVPPHATVDGQTLRRQLDGNRRFHVVIARASGNRRLARLVERTLDEMTRLIALGYETGEHGEVVAALRSGNGHRARAAVVHHVLVTRERVLKRETGGLLRDGAPRSKGPGSRAPEPAG